MTPAVLVARTVLKHVDHTEVKTCKNLQTTDEVFPQGGAERVAAVHLIELVFALGTS
jgi:hypothetical protein